MLSGCKVELLMLENLIYFFLLHANVRVRWCGLEEGEGSDDDTC